MRRLRAMWMGVHALFRRNRLDRELAAELESHLAHHIDDNLRAGMTPEAARRLALVRLGGVEQIKERHRDARSIGWLEDAKRDATLAARQLRHNPLYALAAIPILAIGIALNLTVFQLLNVTALRPLPIADAGTLVRFDRITKAFSSNGVPYPATQFIRHNNSVLAAVLTSHSTDAVWEDEPTDRLRASYVSANWFAELGFRAHLGRLFAEAVDEQADAAPAVVVSYTFWRTRLLSAPVVGRSVRINDRPATIIGVAPAHVPGLQLEDAQIWLLIHQIDRFNEGMAFTDAWGSHNTQLYGRLRPGVSASAAREGLRATSRALADLRPKEFAADDVLQPYSAREGFRNPREQRELHTLALLAGGLTMVVLVVACANLSNVVLSQAIRRLRELSVRAALGATRGRLLRQLLVESAIVSALGALGGFAISHWAIRATAAYTSLPTYLDLAADWRTVVATSIAAGLVTIAVGLMPAWLVIRRDLITAMKDGGHQASHGLARAPVRLLLVGSQVAGCAVLLIVAALIAHGVQRLLTRDRGFEFDRVAVLEASPGRYGVRDDAARVYWEEVQRAIREANSDVEELALASEAPLGRSTARSKYNDAPALVVTSLNVSPSFFTLLGIPIVAGRSFAAHDRADLAVIISRRLAAQMYGTQDVVGKGFPRSAPSRTIVGVAADAPLVDVTATHVAQQYVPIDESRYGDVLLLARTTGNPGRLLTPMRAAARAADRRVLPKTWLPSTAFEERVRERRVARLVAMLVGGLALSLACFGIVGLVSCGAAVRTKEIGIRRALGAERRAITALLLRQLLVPVALGLLVGTIAGLAVGGMLEGAPYHLPAIDVGTIAAALTILVVTAALAVIGPVFRALGTDPVQALRHE